MTFAHDRGIKGDVHVHVDFVIEAIYSMELLCYPTPWLRVAYYDGILIAHWNTFFSNDGNASQNKIKAIIMSASKYLLCIAKKILDDFTVAEYLHIHHFVTFFNLYLNIIRFDCYCTNLHFSSNFQICVNFVNRGKVSFQLESFCAAFEEEHKDPEEYKLFGLIADRLYCSVHRVFLRRTDFDERDKFRQRELQ